MAFTYIKHIKKKIIEFEGLHTKKQIWMMANYRVFDVVVVYTFFDVALDPPHQLSIERLLLLLFLAIFLFNCCAFQFFLVHFSIQKLNFDTLSFNACLVSIFVYLVCTHLYVCLWLFWLKPNWIENEIERKWLMSNK